MNTTTIATSAFEKEMTNGLEHTSITPQLVTQVGRDEFNSNVSLDTLRSIYLKPILPRKQFEYIPTKEYPPVRVLPTSQKKRILVTGGAGFVGSHLVDRLMLMGHEVTVVDNFFTGNKRNVEHWIGHPHFELVRHDIIEHFAIEVHQIYHLACPASPPHYQYNPIKTIKTSVLGTINMLGLAKRIKARLLFTSTSEVYGDPDVHPQTENYWGNVNCIGPRACYDEGKRVAETLIYSYKQQEDVDVRVARIFNTYGPRMNEHDGRVVSNFIMQALQGQDLTVYGNGQQTRSFQYVHDLVDGLIQLMNSDYSMPVNIGNPDEYTIKQFAQSIISYVDSPAKIAHLPATEDDPKQRRPDIRRAQEEIDWAPRFSLAQGIAETVEYFRMIVEIDREEARMDEDMKAKQDEFTKRRSRLPSTESLK